MNTPTRVYMVKVHPVPIPLIMNCVIATIIALSKNREIINAATSDAAR